MHRAEPHRATLAAVLLLLSCAPGAVAAAEAPELIKQFVAGREHARSIDFSPDGKTLAITIDDGTITLWDVATAKKSRTILGHEGRIVFAVRFSPDGKLLASAGFDKTVRLWDVTTGKMTKVLLGHRDCVEVIDFSPDGQYVVSGGQDGVARIWEITTGNEVGKVGGYGNVWTVSFRPDGKSFVTGGLGNPIRIWDTASYELVEELDRGTNASTCTLFTPDGNIFIENSAERGVQLRDASSMKKTYALRGHKYRCGRAAIAADSRLLATVGSQSSVIKFWDVVTPKYLGTVTQRARTMEVAFSPDYRLFAATAMGGTVSIWAVPEAWRKPGSSPSQ